MKHFDLSVLFPGEQVSFIKLYPGASNIDSHETVIIPEESFTKTLLKTVSNYLIGQSLEDDLRFFIERVEVENKILTLILNTNLQNKKEVKATPTFTISENEIQGNTELVLEYFGPKDLKEIKFQATIDGEAYHGRKKVSFVNHEKIFDIAIDFGSEASQMTIRNHAGNYHLFRFPIAEQLMKWYEVSNGSNIHQYEGKDLYRSLFFIKKNNVNFDLEKKPGKVENELVPLITKKEDADHLKDNYKLISNLKLAHLGAYDFYIDFDSHYGGKKRLNFNETISDTQQKIINGFLFAALEEIEKKIGKGSEFYIRVKLLVPNILSQEDVTYLIENTNLFLNNHKVNSKLRGFQTQTLSESDASFLGYWAETSSLSFESNRVPNTRFVIIDMGKGTTDFSVISSNENFEISSEFRSGFIGAGNVITYAFIETIFSFIFGKNEVEKRKAIKKLLMSDATVFQLEFLEKIESLKANFGKGPEVKSLSDLEYSSEIQTMLEGRDLGTINDSQINRFLNEVLQQQASILDEYGYVSKKVKKLSEKILDSLNFFVSNQTRFRGKPTKVILTGRSFLFHPLVESLSRHFDDFKSDIEIIMANTNNDQDRLKKICLEGAFGEQAINYNSNLIGLPIVPDNSVIKTAIKRKVRKGTSMKSGNKSSRWKQLGDFFGLTDDIVPELGNSSVLVEPEKKIEKPIELKPFSEGNDLLSLLLGRFKLNKEFTVNKDTIYISGVHYTLDGLNTLDTESLRLYFDGENIFARTNKARIKLNIPPRFASEKLFLFETLFPFNSHVAERNIVVETDISSIPNL